MDYQPYPEYRESGIEWLGKVPDHWEVRRLKFAAEIQNGRDYKDVESSEGYPVFGSGGVFRFATEYLYDGESVLFGRKGTIDKPLYINEKFWTVDTMFYSVIFDGTHGRFLYFVATTLQFSLLATQTALPSITQSDLGNYRIAFPCYEEQQIIAQFLDHKTQQIDQLIAKKQTLIGKLNEQRIALITHAVTKGLKPDVKMKPSGVEWLGDVPEHWDIRKLKFAIMFQRGHDLPADSREDGDVPLVSSSGISATHSTAIAKAPGIVTGRYGTIGKFVYVGEDYWPINTTLYSIDTYENNVRFLWYMMHNFTEIFLLNSKKSAVPGVDRNDIHPELTVLPPIEEQIQIVEHLDAETARIDRMVELNRETIDKLKEYRTALITAAVTGKIDLRTWQENKEII
jgi:type I restriction enzyme S subunit